MLLLQATGGIASTNCYVVADETTGDCVLIDAPDHTVAPLLDEIEARGWYLNALWLTHGHFDHLADHLAVKNRFPDAKVLIHELDVPKLHNPGSAMFPLPFKIPPGQPDVILHDGDTLTVGNLTAQVLFTPGHSPGHVCFYFNDQKTLLGGDLIIGGAIGRTDLPGCSVPDMQQSLQRVMKLPEETRLLGGHGPTSTLAQERKSNPYLRLALEGRLAEL
jgi:glyoxylase-like metal-dependent hydrolase (beta-lactamase superfamily II)